MATFHVGQRVRIIDAEVSTFLIGTETVILALNVQAIHYGRSYIGHKTAAINAQGMNFIPEPHQIEPITYDGNNAVKWEECLWQPPREVVNP